MEFYVDECGEYDNFIMDAMRAYDPAVYTDADFDIFKHIEHDNIIYFDKSFNILTFCTIIVTPEHYKMSYTWCNGTRESIRAYVKGIDYVLARYNPLAFGEGALKFNKIRRVTS